MLFKLVFLLLLVQESSSAAAASTNEGGPGFVYNGFTDSGLTRDGIAEITPNGLLSLTNDRSFYRIGHAFYSQKLQFKNYSSDGNTTVSTTLSFSTTFVFAVVSLNDSLLMGHGLAFVLSPLRELPGGSSSQHLGLFNATNNGDPTNHIVAVELDTFQNQEFGDIDHNHVGIDINSLISVESASAKYFTRTKNGELISRNLNLKSGDMIQVWIEYDGLQKQLNVTMAPVNMPKPDVALLSLSRDLTPIILDSMYVGFSSSTGRLVTYHYVLGWSFKINGKAQDLDFPQLPKLPKPPKPPKKKLPKMLTIGLPIIISISAMIMIYGIILIVRRKRKFAEVVEEWELSYGPHRFTYKDLYKATKGFREKELIGKGGFGRVYRGVLPTSKIEVAVKRVSHDSKQGIKEFIAEIISLGQLRHRNLVQLLGYCRRKGELLLVYDFMPNGSLDKFLFGSGVGSSSSRLNWRKRFQIIKGVASGLLYLHEEWDQLVIHRDVKASNVLLDSEMNARLSDFGLARLYDHGTDISQTTKVVGTLGYLAPELTRTRKGSTSTDVYAFGAFLLEVACGRRPTSSPVETLSLVGWVLCRYRRGAVLETSDPFLGSEYVVEEMELVLKLGLLCSHNVPKARPTMRQVVQYLNGDTSLLQKELWSLDTTGTISLVDDQSLEDFASSYPVDMAYASLPVESLLSGPR